MTYTKQLRILEGLLPLFFNVEVVTVIDTYQAIYNDRFGELSVKYKDPHRFKVQLQEIYNHFKDKNGRWYNFFKVTSDFNELVKAIKTGNHLVLHVEFRDTKEMYFKECEARKLNPFSGSNPSPVASENP